MKENRPLWGDLNGSEQTEFQISIIGKINFNFFYLFLLKVIAIFCVGLMLIPKPAIAFFRASYAKKKNKHEFLLFEENYLNPNLLWHDENKSKKEIVEIELHDIVRKKNIKIYLLLIQIKKNI